MESEGKSPVSDWPVLIDSSVAREIKESGAAFEVRRIIPRIDLSRNYFFGRRRGCRPSTGQVRPVKASSNVPARMPTTNKRLRRHLFSSSRSSFRKWSCFLKISKLILRLAIQRFHLADGSTCPNPCVEIA